MELELRQEYISCWEKGQSARISQEETTEMIVPDACPDILQILDGEGRLLLQRKEALDGKAEFSGCIRVGVLYQPDGDRCLCSMDCVLPFSKVLESDAIGRSSNIVVCPTVEKVDVHILNPRKILVKVNFTLDVRVFSPSRLSYCSHAEEKEPLGICQKSQTHQSHLTKAVEEKQFSYTDTLTLPAGNPNLIELLRFRTDCQAREAKVIGNKLLFKGEALVEILYLTEEDRLCTALFTLPFSQMMEVGEVGEDCQAAVQIHFTDAICKGFEERSLTVELELLAQGILEKNEEMSLLTDLYSTQKDAMPHRKAYQLRRLMDHGVAPESHRQLLECTRPVEAVLDLHLRPLQMTMAKEGGELTMTAELEAFVLCRVEGGDLDGLHRHLTVSHCIPTAHEWDYSGDFWLSRQATALPVAGGVELSLGVDFQWSAIEGSGVESIVSVNLEDRQPSDEAPPSIVIRAVRSGESLWDIAKHYHTTEEELSEANALPTGELYQGQMLLIPG